jgi:hypothetical protein
MGYLHRALVKAWQRPCDSCRVVVLLTVFQFGSLTIGTLRAPRRFQRRLVENIAFDNSGALAIDPANRLARYWQLRLLQTKKR